MTHGEDNEYFPLKLALFSTEPLKQVVEPDRWSRSMEQVNGAGQLSSLMEQVDRAGQRSKSMKLA